MHHAESFTTKLNLFKFFILTANSASWNNSFFMMIYVAQKLQSFFLIVLS